MNNHQISKPARPKAPKIFRCTGYGDCTMSFTRYEHLARHIRKHTGERPYKCHCNRTFSRLDNLRQHAQTVHQGEQPIYTTVLTPTMPGQLSQRVVGSENTPKNLSSADGSPDCSFRLSNVHGSKINDMGVVSDTAFDSNSRPTSGKLPTKSRYGSHKRRPHPIYVPESRINSAEVLSTSSTASSFPSPIPSSTLTSANGTITHTYLPASPLSADAATSMGPRTAPPTMGNYPKLMSPNSMPPLAYAMLNSPYPGQPPLGSSFMRGSYPRTPLSGYPYVTTPRSGASPGLSQYSLPYYSTSNGSPPSASQQPTGYFTNIADVHRSDNHSSITPTKTPLPQLSFPRQEHSNNSTLPTNQSSSHQRIPSMPTEVLSSHVKESSNSLERPLLRRGSSTNVLPDVRNLLNGPSPSQFTNDLKIPITSLRTSPGSVNVKADDFGKPRQPSRMSSSHALKYVFDPIHDSLAQRSEAN